MDCLDGARRQIAKRCELMRRFISEDGGQDIIEYALIAVFFGIVGMLTLEAIEGAIDVTYRSWIDPVVGTPSLWAPNEP
jgi:Flp pilus assembly pilin Flp